jgi:hypothetical protein
MSIDLRFLSPRSTCAICGRECDADGAPVVAELDPEVATSLDGTHMLVDVTLGEQLVICEDCAAK